MSFAVHKLARFLSNPSKIHFKGLVHLFVYMRDKKTLGLKYYSDMKDSHLSNLSRQANINTENQLMAFSGSSWQGCPDTYRSTVAYIIFYQGGTIYHGTHVPVQVSQSSA